MIRSFQLSSTQLPWLQLVAQLPLPCSTLLANLQSGNAQQVAWARGYSTESNDDVSAEQDLQQAARELGLDAMRLPQLRGMMAGAMHRDTEDNAVLGVEPPPAKQKKLTYSDIQGYEELLQSLVFVPDDFRKQMPKAPALNAGQWVDAHFKHVGYGLEPRGPFYVWRAWAAAALPREQVETLVAMESVMADDNQRSALLKQAQHELARLWDWQHRRAALGLPMDLPPGSSSSSSSSDKEFTPVTEAAAAESKAAATPVSFDATSKQNVLEVLDESAAIEAEKQQQQQQSGVAQQFNEALQSPAAAAAPSSRWMFAVEDVASSQGKLEKEARARLEKRVASERQLQRRSADAVREKLRSAERGRFRTLLTDDVVLRKYQPVVHDDDLFLPGKPLGSSQIAAQLADPSKTQPVDPNRVVRQAVAITEAAKHAAVLAAQSPTVVLGFGGSTTEGAEWTSMPLLDRGVLHQERLRQEERRLAAKPKMTLPWQLLPLDSYTFDLEVRPPTQTLDLLTNYLEVRYADILLRKDTVTTLQKQMAVASLTNSSSTGRDTEFLETPPAILTAAKTLSPAEREGVIQALDDMLHNKQYERYKEAVLQLYCDGLVSWGELQQCWAAAQAGEELTAAAEGPVTFADNRQQLFDLLSGQQQFGSLSSSSAAVAAQITAADEAAARKLWTDAGSKLQHSWAEAAAAQSSSSSSDKAGKDAWAEPISFEEAQQTWQQLLQLAGMSHDGPRFEQVLLAGSSSSTAEQEQLQQQLQKLQQALSQATGLTAGSSAAAAATPDGAAAAAALEVVSVDNFEQLQQLFADPPKLEDLLKQHWEQVSRKELGENIEWSGPTWQQLWQLLQALTHKQQQQSSETAAAAATADVSALFNKYLKEAEAVPLTPPPYPGARRLLRWEQRIILGPTSGQVVTSAEVKVKLSVSAAELQHETGLSDEGLQHLLRVAGSRYNAVTGVLSLSCDRFPTREENRRWCLEVLHRLLQEGQAAHPSNNFLLGPAGAAAAQAAALQYCGKSNSSIAVICQL